MFKKKYSLLISSILFLIGSFIFNWYTYDISIILFILLFVIFHGLFIIIIINCIKKISVNKTISFISIFIMLLTIILHFNFPFEEIKLNVEWNKYDELRYEVINLVKEDKLEFDLDTKIAILPNNYKKISQTGEILIYENSSENQMIGFFINRGMLSGSKILIYSTGGSELIEDNEKYIKNIKKIRDNWYYVETN